MSAIDAVAGMVAGDTHDWTPTRLIEVFCAPGLRSGFRECGRKDDARSHWHAGFCAYQGKDAYGAGIDGFDDGHHLWGDLISSGWSLIQDPGDRQFPYAFYMRWRPRTDAADGTAERSWCIAHYCEGDFGVEVYDDEEAYRTGEAQVRAV